MSTTSVALVLMLCGRMVPGNGWPGIPASGPASVVISIGTERTTDAMLPACGCASLRRGLIWSRRYSSGAHLDVFCRRAARFKLCPVYVMNYVDAAGNTRRIGQCVFRSGCNSVVVRESLAGPGKVELIETTWLNIDGGSNDGQVSFGKWKTGPEEPALDEILWDFVVSDGSLTITNLKYPYPDGKVGLRGCGAATPAPASHVSWVETVK